MKTIENQFKQLRLLGMYVSWNALRETRQHHELSLSEGLELLLHAEQEDRNNRRFERLKRSAKFRYSATIEEFNFEASRGLNKSQITELAMGNYLTHFTSSFLRFSGATVIFIAFCSNEYNNYFI